MVELLILHGVNPFHRLKDNSTMIIQVAKSGHTRAVSLLLDYPSSILVTPEQAQISSGMNITGQVPINSEDTAVSSPAGVTDSVPTPAPRVTRWRSGHDGPCDQIGSTTRTARGSCHCLTWLVQYCLHCLLSPSQYLATDHRSLSDSLTGTQTRVPAREGVAIR